jgi:hypothetical protein
MPTGGERTIWGFGDGSTLDVARPGRIAGSPRQSDSTPALTSAPSRSTRLRKGGPIRRAHRRDRLTTAADSPDVVPTPQTGVRPSAPRASDPTTFDPDTCEPGSSRTRHPDEQQGPACRPGPDRSLGGGGGGNRTRVLRRVDGSSPGAVSGVPTRPHRSCSQVGATGPATVRCPARPRDRGGQ